MRFEELTSNTQLLRAIKDQGWTQPTPIQVQAIPPARAGRDLVGIAQTGTGKTAAFLLPALERQFERDGLHTLVLCPTRELCQQVAADGRALAQHASLFVGAVYGGMPLRPQIRDLRAGFDVLIATPGRLLDHIERGTVDLSQIEVLVLDEADRMLDMGFRPQIEAILRALPAPRQTLFFSATMPNGVHALALRILRDPVWIEVTPQSTTATGIDQCLYIVSPDQKLPLLLELLRRPDWDQVLIFTATKRGGDFLVARLRSAGVSADVLHADRAMHERRSALAAFTEGHVPVLVATDIAQRGLDIEGITHVINYDVPRKAEDYVHRIGRTGRAGATGEAITFMSGAEAAQVADIERMLGYRLSRFLPDGSATEAPPVQTRAARSNGRGERLGARREHALTPDQLRELLKVG